MTLVIPCHCIGPEEEKPLAELWARARGATEAKRSRGSSAIPSLRILLSQPWVVFYGPCGPEALNPNTAATRVFCNRPWEHHPQLASDICKHDRLHRGPLFEVYRALFAVGSSELRCRALLV